MNHTRNIDRVGNIYSANQNHYSHQNPKWQFQSAYLRTYTKPFLWLFFFHTSFLLLLSLSFIVEPDQKHTADPRKKANSQPKIKRKSHARHTRQLRLNHRIPHDPETTYTRDHPKRKIETFSRKPLRNNDTLANTHVFTTQAENHPAHHHHPIIVQVPTNTKN